jgi:predicted TIM-barrel fold metal-dependent hydrolase
MSELQPVPERIIDVHNHPRKDREPDELIERMDAVNIERTVVLGTSTDSNEVMLRYCRAFPKRFVGGVYLDPRQGGYAREQMRRFHGEGVRIVKLFPNIGYFPDDPELWPFFEQVAELGMAALSHCGWLSPRKGRAYASYYATPGRFEKMARIFTDTPFIMAHMGGINGVLETVMLTTRTPNVYVDGSPGQGLWALECCGQIAGSVPPDKLLFGADLWDYPSIMDRYHRAFCARGYGEHLEKIYRTNAEGIFQKLGV